VSPLLAKRLSDESLGSRLAAGEAAAFDELYRRYVHRLAAYGAHLLGDGAAGDDVAQATMLKAYGALRDGRVPDRVKPWLYRIAHNVAIDLVVRRREVPSAELPERGASDAEPVAGALVAALASLPERQRRVYVLRELHGLRIDETAAELSLSPAQVEQSLFAARNRLAEHLVFGDRLNCVAVQRLAAGPLDADERRALKTHLRSCAGCRSGLGMRGRALGMLPVASLDWLRGLLAGAVGGSAPVAAKVGVVVATATFAAGVPGGIEMSPRLHYVQASRRAAVVTAHHATRAPVAAPPAASPAVSPLRIVSREAEHSTTSAHERSARDGGDATSARAVEPSSATSGETDRSRDGGGAGGGETTTTTVSSSDGPGPGTVATAGATVTTTVAAPVESSHDGSSSRSGSGSGELQVTTTSGSGDGSSSSDDGRDGGSSGGGDSSPTTTTDSSGPG
jgi:RNA polymerase sigma factor (sigma-70 family)